MFENAGAKLRSIIYVFVVIEMIGMVIMGIALMASDMILLGLLVMIGGCISIWLANLFILAVLEMIEDVHAIRTSLQNSTTANIPSYTVTASPIVSTPVPQNQPINNYAYAAKLSGEDSSKVWFCSKCGTKNKNSNRTCSGCGADK